MAGESERKLLVNYEPANGGPRSTAVARDAALGGLFIETKIPLPIGALLSVELSSPSSSVTLEARVFSSRAKDEGKDKPAGMGVTFLDLPAGALGKLTSILQHHRPPARTRLGVGDEKDAMWAAAGGKEEGAPEAESDALAIAANIAVDGRPTPEFPQSPILDDDPPLPVAPGDPKPPRYPTPRMIPLTPRSGAQLPASVPPPPSSVPPLHGGGLVAPQFVVTPPRGRGALIAIVVIGLIAVVVLAVVFLVVLR